MNLFKWGLLFISSKNKMPERGQTYERKHQGSLLPKHVSHCGYANRSLPGGTCLRPQSWLSVGPLTVCSADGARPARGQLPSPRDLRPAPPHSPAWLPGFFSSLSSKPVLSTCLLPKNNQESTHLEEKLLPCHHEALSTSASPYLLPPPTLKLLLRWAVGSARAPGGTWAGP